MCKNTIECAICIRKNVMFIGEFALACHTIKRKYDWKFSALCTFPAKNWLSPCVWIRHWLWHEGGTVCEGAAATFSALTPRSAPSWPRSSNELLLTYYDNLLLWSRNKIHGENVGILIAYHKRRLEFFFLHQCTVYKLSLCSRLFSNTLSCGFNVFTALHGMQTRSSDENSVRLSVCLSVRPRVLWQNGRKICPDFYTIRKNI